MRVLYCVCVVCVACACAILCVCCMCSVCVCVCYVVSVLYSMCGVCVCYVVFVLYVWCVCVVLVLCVHCVLCGVEELSVCRRLLSTDAGIVVSFSHSNKTISHPHFTFGHTHDNSLYVHHAIYCVCVRACVCVCGQIGNMYVRMCVHTYISTQTCTPHPPYLSFVVKCKPR